MSNAIKFKNDNYLDSTGISYNHEVLKSVLDNLKDKTDHLVESYYLGNNPDIDTLKTKSGIYGLYACTKTPVDEIGILEVLVYSQDWVVQRYTSIAGTGSPHTWLRTFSWGTTWSSWQKLY